MSSLLVLAGLLATVPSLGDDGALAGDTPVFEKPAPRVGIAYEYSDRVGGIPCRRWVVTALDADGLLVSTCDKFRSYLSVANDYNPVRIIDGAGTLQAEFKPYYPQLKFPLAVGNKWNAEYEGYTREDDNHWHGTVACEVKAYERIEVAAGRYAAYRIGCQDKLEMDVLVSSAYSQIWYAPAIGAVIKVDNDLDPRWNMELAKAPAAR